MINPKSVLKSEAFHRILLVLGSVIFFVGVLEFLSFSELVDYRNLLSAPAGPV